MIALKELKYMSPFRPSGLIDADHLATISPLQIITDAGSLLFLSDPLTLQFFRAGRIPIENITEEVQNRRGSKTTDKEH